MDVAHVWQRDMSRETNMARGISLGYVSRDIQDGAQGGNTLTTTRVLLQRADAFYVYTSSHSK